MNTRLMILPSIKYDQVRLVKIPDDMEANEAYRCATSLIAGIQEEAGEYTWDDIEQELEDNGFETVEFILGPGLA
ncbi:MAG: hypothetical protein ACE5EH_06415 [Gammaproteobacteria bacterium]